jgi:hypothetical protein
VEATRALSFFSFGYIPYGLRTLRELAISASR